MVGEVQQVHTVTIEPIVVAVARQDANLENYGSAILTCLDTVNEFLKDAPVFQQGPNVALYFDGGKTVAAGVQVSDRFEPAGAVECLTTPAGKAAMTIHLGPYSELSAAHRAVRAWCTENNQPMVDPCWEIYGDWDDDPRKLRTVVYYRVADA